MVQTPGPGERAPEGSNVSITISRGPKPFSLPTGLSGRPRDEVVARLNALGLTVTARGVTSTEAFGTVVAVSPSTGLRPGSTVVVTYSTGVPRVDTGGGGKKHGKGEKGD
jgi:beta-lactam-binding protein with PASTA domain